MKNPVLTHVIGDERLSVFYDEDAQNPIEEFDGVDENSQDYKAWLDGDVYGFIVEKRCECCGAYTEIIDSCWGFYGREWAKEAITDHAGEKWKAAFNA